MYIARGRRSPPVKKKSPCSNSLFAFTRVLSRSTHCSASKASTVVAHSDVCCPKERTELDGRSVKRNPIKNSGSIMKLKSVSVVSCSSLHGLVGLSARIGVHDPLLGRLRLIREGNTASGE
jgi:hypothetical protein